MKTGILKTVAFCSLFVFGLNSQVLAQAYTENFDNISTLTASGWFQQNNSTTIGSNPNWIQGVATPTGPFDAFNGAASAYICANFNSTTGANTISNWLVTPNRTLRNGDVFTFYTRRPTPNPTEYPDRLEVRLSTNGASTNVGTGSAAVGDFTTLLLSINPSLVTGVYPATWTQFTITISGLPAPTSGRIAFRYFVTNGGPSGSNSDFIGIDNVVYTPYTCPSFTMTPTGALTGGTAGSAYSFSLSQTGALGTPNYAITAGALPPGLTLASNGTLSGTPTATGTFNFTATVSDNSGCSGSAAYSITVVCPANPTSLNGLPTLCSNNSPITLTQGLPAGGTYSGTGVSGGMFDPASGTQTITYDYTDPYGCAHSTSGTITVNTPPTVTQAPISAVCDNEGLVALTGGSPAGGTYSGTGVTGTDFDPAAGTQTIMYSYTDANSCTNTTSTSITVNAAPTVSQTPFTAVCDNDGAVALTGGSPMGGTYSGTGVTGTDFDPAAGTQNITYTYTDGNGCSNDATETITVNAAPSVSLSAFTAVCEDAAAVTLTEGTPAGGAYTGTGVTGNMFDPAAGTQTIIYTYTDANGCSGSDNGTFTVNSLPAVTLSLPTNDLCVYNSAITLSGGTPASGSFTGNGVSGGMFNPATAGLGVSTITYTFTDGNGCTGTATDQITVDECLSVKENGIVNVNVFPNPSNGVFFVEKVQQANIKGIVDIQGRSVAFVMNQMENGVGVELQNAPSGIYILELNIEQTATTVRLVKN